LEEAFGYVGLDYKEYVRIDPIYFRPTEVDYLLADPSKSRSILGWQPRVLFRELVRIMVDADLELIGLESPGEGVRVLEGKFGDWHHWKDQVISMEK
jgi:GDPmannose 4,6-dehydratase